MKDFILYWFPPLAWMAFIFPMNFMLTAACPGQSLVVNCIINNLSHAGNDNLTFCHYLYTIKI